MTGKERSKENRKEQNRALEDFGLVRRLVYEVGISI